MNHINLIRNFVIISHVDHGKSTLADRFLELTKTVPPEKMRPQYLDRMPLERERGITIKLQPVTMIWHPPNYQIRSTKHEIRNKFQIQNSNNQNQNFGFRILDFEFSDSGYILNLIDTPGHVDFSYEVSRSLAAVEGAILLVDASQGIQAQTLANLDLALKQGLTIIPVINKIDLPNLDLESVQKELANLLKIDQQEIILVSAKKGINIEQVLSAIIKKIPPPIGDINKPLRALVFDSVFDEYKGVVVFVRLFEGSVKAGQKIKFLRSEAESEVLEVGIFGPDLKKKDSLSAGEIGYIITDLKDIKVCRVGDTVTQVRINADTQTQINEDIRVNQRKYQRESAAIEPLPGYQEPQPMVFAGFYPKIGSDSEKLRRALEKLKLNDASLIFEPERSPALGFGFRCGFLGLLHLDIVKERLAREYGIDVIITTPSVAYQIELKNGQTITIHSPEDLPDWTTIEKIAEPWVKLEVIVPAQYVGSVMKLAKEYRAKFVEMKYLTAEEEPVRQKVVIDYELPLSLLLADFYDKLKSVSSGYASYHYQFLDYRPADLVKMDILVAGERIKALSTIVYRDSAYQSGRRITKTLKEVLPRQLFEVKIQAAIGGKIIASEHLPPMRKDVTAKLYGGDVTRKMKLLAKQKKGKKKLLKLGKVDIPPEAYLAVLKR